MFVSTVTDQSRKFVFGCVETYRYGFNGKEKDNEVSGEGDNYDYGARVYDPRLGKFFSVDPYTSKFAMLTPYQFASNSPIQGIDIDGNEIGLSFTGGNFGLNITFGKVNRKTVFKITELNVSGVMQVPITEQAGVTLTTSYNLNEGFSLNTKVNLDLPATVDPETQSNPSYAAEAKFTVNSEGVSMEYSGSGEPGTNYVTSENKENSEKAEEGFENSGIEKQENDNSPIVKNPSEYDENVANMAAKKDYSMESADQLKQAIIKNTPKPGTGGLSPAPTKPIKSILGIEVPKTTKEFVQQMRQNIQQQKKPILQK